MVKWRQSSLLLFALSSGLYLSLLSPPSHGVDESNLWLPISYRPHYMKLIRAAKLVEDNAHDCQSILRGELQASKSTKEHPVFRIVCRNQAKRSFAIIIDGLAMEVIDPAFPGGTVSFEELEVLRLQALAQKEKEAELEAQRQELIRQQALWLKCEEKVAERTKMMKDKVILTTEAPAAEVGPEQSLKFLLDFDAKTPQGKALRYRAICHFNESETLKVSIRPRRTIAKDAPP